MRLPTLGGARDPLPADEIDTIIDDEFGPRLESLGFERIRRRTWVRSDKVPIREEIGVGALKGYSFGPGWSVSLDFVPHVTSTGTVKTHRTAKQHVADLGVDPLDLPSEFDLGTFTVHGMASRRPVERAMRRSAIATIRSATSWFDRISDVRSLLPLYEEAIEQPVHRFGFDNHVQYRLSYAFVLAATSQGEAAREQLDQWCDLHLSSLAPDRASRVRSELHERLAGTEG